MVGSIGGFVYEDQNEDSVYQPEEPLLAQAVVQLWQGEQLYEEQVTIENGLFFFDDLPAKQFTLQETAPPGYYIARPTDSITLLGERRPVQEVQLRPPPLPHPHANPAPALPAAEFEVKRKT